VREESECAVTLPKAGGVVLFDASTAFVLHLMNSSRDTSTLESVFGDGRPVTELSLVEIASRLEKITSAIEEQRTRERGARKVYKTVAEEVEQEIERIRGHARTLLMEQRRRMDSFNGMLSKSPDPLPPATNGRDLREVKMGGALASLELEPRTGRETGAAGGRLSIADAMLKVWTLDQYNRPLTTEEIMQALTDVGYTSKASPRSMKSTLNQVLAKLCRERRIRRFRTDGAEIDASDTHSRARKYLLA
jgi:hypothetical protein